nr:hypothetical protein OG409_07800 [Streptomyces sp. NBC_00974]
MTDNAPEPEVRQVVVHPAIWPHLEAWLNQRNVSLALLFPAGEDLATYVMTLNLPDTEEQSR